LMEDEVFCNNQHDINYLENIFMKQFNND